MSTISGLKLKLTDDPMLIDDDMMMALSPVMARDSNTINTGLFITIDSSYMAKQSAIERLRSSR